MPAFSKPVEFYMQKRINPLDPFRLTSGTLSVLRWLGDKGAIGFWLAYEIPGNRRTQKIFSGNLSRLKKDGFIKKDGMKVIFTEKGRLAYLKLKIERCGLLPEDQVCLVVFDVPEKERRLRKLVRKFLNSAGFFSIQKSVWMSRFDATKELNEYFCLIGLDDKILAFTAKK